jgi:hypothetical protein
MVNKAASSWNQSIDLALREPSNALDHKIDACLTAKGQCPLKEKGKEQRIS